MPDVTVGLVPPSSDGLRELGQLLADWRGEAAVLRRRGDARAAELLEQCATEVDTVAADYLTWLSETEAMLRSGRARPWLRTRFAEWQREGHARWRGRERQYRALVVPRRAQVVAAQQAGAEAARLQRHGRGSR